MLLSTEDTKSSRIHSFIEEQKAYAPHYLPPDEIPISIIISDEDNNEEESSLVLTSISQRSRNKNVLKKKETPTIKSNGLHLLEVFIYCCYYI